MDKAELISRIEKYDEVKELTKKILEIYDGWNSPYGIKYIANEENNISIGYSFYSHGENCYEDLNIPFEWFDLSDEELKLAIKNFKIAEKEAYEKEKALATERYEREKEEKERKEYERLKAKFANG